MNLRLFFLFFLITQKTSLLFCEEHTIVFNQPDDVLDIGKEVFLLQDKKSSFSIKQVMEIDSFCLSTQEVPNLGITSFTHWIRFSIKNETAESKLFLQVQHPIIDDISFFEIDSSNKIRVVHSGEQYPFFQRKYNHKDFLFDFDLSIHETKTFYLKIKSGEQITLPMIIGNQKAILELTILETIISGLYYGIMLVMILYNLFIFFSVRDMNYLYYVFYIIFVGLTQACLHGYAYQFLWPGSSMIAIQSMYWVPALVGIFALVFIKKFLQIDKWRAGIINAFVFAYLISIVLSLFEKYNESQNLIQSLAMLGSFYALYLGIFSYRRGNRAAKYFLFAWSLFLISVIVFVLKTFNIFPHTTLTNYILLLGSSAETVLLSFALADRINILKKEKETILEHQAKTLKVKVKEATADLEHTLNRLRNTQAQLVQNQKMVSIGQLAAGVAHEVNNPLNIINLSLNAIAQDTQDLQDCVEILLPHVEQDTQKFVLEVKEYQVLKTEIKTSLDTAQRSVNRTKNITENLKAFSQVDTSGPSIRLQRFELDIVLNIVRQQLGNISLVKQYSRAPFLVCKPQALNELFYNIILNAIEAIYRKYGGLDSQGEIHISLDEKDGYIIFCVEDNGEGMDEGIQSKIFEPFFTTKGVEGKGLGLYTTYHSMQELGGRVEVVSTKGVGTSLYLFFPKPDTA